MDDVVELVHLPDPSIKPLVHPLDLAEAGGGFRTGWLIGVLGSPAVGLVVGVMAWRLGAGYLIAVVAGLSLVAIATVASRHQIDESWAFIPRRRQDRSRALPVSWQAGAGILSGAAIVLAAWLAVPGLDALDLPSGVVEFILGAAVAIAVLVGIDLASSALIRRGSYVDRPWFGVPILIGVVVATIGLASTLLSSDSSVLGANAALGALMILAVGGVLVLWRAMTGRRGTPDRPDESPPAHR